ncbi:glycosyltransferase family 4 protein [Pelosinus propionicus]|uniref:Glycosyltransferase involved in cell wall bisynthesis n=1 Tax=Pelosinus propionicus DSM 13327 TaxID=1123291 RepID=A0A1I4IPV9_9FIRM|nr:glycosyltransferase family 4 protein [Pelosinus propionicus]SFL56334.1 Glycosyltransferase involved in cell wall bisynthesis [Pelosinus propionicus DSM 13327]
MKKLLVLNHFPTIFPPNTGGVLRYFHLYNQLSNDYDITLLSQKYTPEVENVTYSDTFREYKIPTNEIQHEIDKMLMGEGIGPRFSTHAALSCSLIHEPPTSFLKYYYQFYEASDIIIHESPFMLKYDIYFGLKRKPRIYNSHNHESEFAKHVWRGNRSHEYVNYITKLEEILIKNAAIVFATSEEERESFLKAFSVDNQKIKLSPNGINPEEWHQRVSKSLTNQKGTAFFIGSMHEPNIEIVKFIVYQLAPKCKHIDFIIAGQCGLEFSKINIPNVKILGEIDHKQKVRLFSEVDIAINPAFFGTGTKIKTLEFLSAGIPLLSTDIGVKGINLAQGTHYFHAAHENFALTLNEVLRDRQRLESVADNGQKYVNQQYSWEGIAKMMKKQIDVL